LFPNREVYLGSEFLKAVTMKNSGI
jgi:hypothetical protein